MKTVNIQVNCAAAHPGQDRRLPSVATHSRLWRATSVRSGVGIVFKKKTAPGSLSTGSLAGRTPPHGDGSMYSQANVRAGKVLLPIRALPSVIVDTEKVLRGPKKCDTIEECLLRVERCSPRGAPRKPVVMPVRNPKNTSGDKRLNRLISYIHHTCEYKQYCYVGNTAKQCRLGLFQDSDFAGDLEDFKSTSGGTLCVSGSHTFVPISWMCKKQTSVSHSSTESEIISLGAGLRLDGIPALDLWDLIVFVLGNTTQNHDRTGKPVVCRDKNHVRHQSRGVINILDNVDLVPSNVRFSHQEALLFVFEDNEAVIKMIFKGRSPTMRHVSRTHRVALDWFFDRINLDPKI